ncbi:MAG: Glucose-6-phosphate isomerase [Firmicutes bacterium ADurb.Bin182]|nr:MAG: Glucose-6-phosphate isomerase [Firmicutes bacterium ADurb.Bin182]
MRYKDPDWCEKMRIRFDYNNMMSDMIGKQGISKREIEDIEPRAEKAVLGMAEKRHSMKWRELPYINESVIGDILETSDEIRSRFENFVILGIGGSALGPVAAQQALNHQRYNELNNAARKGPRLYIEDNIDPERMNSLLDIIDVKKSMFNCITKSGGTSETMAQLMIVTGILKQRLNGSFGSNIIATTDANRGSLIKIARDYKLRTFYIPEGVGGRFSELSPVGLLPAAVCGIDIKELLAGAAYMDRLCGESDFRKNPAYMMSVMQLIAMEKGCNISVFMPYSDALKYMSDWYAQLWAESLGKKFDRSGKIVNTGQTPVKALGVTDQHSQIQLYTEGPYDKVVTFLKTDKFRTVVEIPREFEDMKDVSFLGGHTLNELLSAEQAATEYALSKSGHMNNKITLPEVNAFTIGQLIFMLEMATAFAGELLNINAFDQPGVEEGKNAAFALLGRPGYEGKKAELGFAPKKLPDYVI